MEGSKERQGDFVFTAKEPGEYRFCFNNEMSTWVEKMVDFEIAVRTFCPFPLPRRFPSSITLFSAPCLIYFPHFHLKMREASEFNAKTPSCVKRSRTNPAPPRSLPNKALPPNKPPLSRNPSTKSRTPSPPSTATRNTFERGRTGT